VLLRVHVYQWNTDDGDVYNSTAWAGCLINIASKTEVDNCMYIADLIGAIHGVTCLRVPLDGDYLGEFVATIDIPIGSFLSFEYYNKATANDMKWIIKRNWLRKFSTEEQGRKKRYICM
jgi:3D (Asp-Asp-Asp) domain-containing protein